MTLTRLLEFSPAVRATLLPVGSNVFMTFAWYAHLRNLRAKPLIIAIAVSWGIALLYMRQPLRVDFLWAGLCLVGAVYFVFRT